MLIIKLLIILNNFPDMDIIPLILNRIKFFLPKNFFFVFKISDIFNNLIIWNNNDSIKNVFQNKTKKKINCPLNLIKLFRFQFLNLFFRRKKNCGVFLFFKKKFKFGARINYDQFLTNNNNFFFQIKKLPKQNYIWYN